MTPSADMGGNRIRRRRGLHPVAIACLPILLALFVTYYAFNKGLPFMPKYTDYAIVADSVGVRGGDPVRIAGIDVGSVESVTDSGHETRIAFSLDPDALPIHADSTVTIRDRLFLEGSYYLDLFPGSPGAPVAPAGFTIPERNTTSPVQQYKLLSLFDASARRAFADTTETFAQALTRQPHQPLSASGAAGLKAAIPVLTPVFEDVSRVAGSLQGEAPSDVMTLISSTAKLMGTVAADTGSLTGLVNNLHATTTALIASGDSLARSVTGLDQVLQAAPPALEAVDRSLAPTTTLSNALAPSLRTAPPILDTLTASVQRLSKVVAPAERSRLLSALRTTFEQVPSLVRQLSALFPITQDITDCLRTHVTPVLDSVVPDGRLSSGQPVWRDYTHFLAGLASAAQNFDGNGYWLRQLVGAGTNTIALGSIPGVGQVVGSTPSTSQIAGERPVWHGDLTSQAFQPGVPCNRDPVPSLTSTTGAPEHQLAGARTTRSPLSLQLRRALTVADRRVSAR